MNTYTILPKKETLSWDEVPELAITNNCGTEDSGVKCYAKICYDEHALYVRLRSVEKFIRAENPKDAPYERQPCEDSCLEFFFCPRKGDRRYFNIEMNPNCLMYLGIGTGIDTLSRIYPNKDWFHPEAERTPDGWRVTYEVPYEFVRFFFPEFSPKSGDDMLANCYKCGDFTKIPHFLSWNPLPEGSTEFHNASHFGIMHFA